MHNFIWALLITIGAVALICIVSKLIGKALMEGFIEVARKHNREAKNDAKKEKE